ncbi:hypothetical protein Vadar_016957 [Vaccinium darrowii]|uniref:Uncharacterized protein n=1 Tax=Vaccinium darrowii TaxID=229202 RepID=A0ACB7Z577_9ERIC|nr:hypothetical protein Vadar_016957 [Vaccinium darrowii]
MHLLRLFERKGEEGQLLDMVDKHNADMQLHGAEVVEMMKVAAWCLQSDYQRRPSMTVVVQVLDGFVIVPDNLEYNFINAPARRTMAATGEDMDAINDGTPLLASVLSGPRIYKEIISNTSTLRPFPSTSVFMPLGCKSRTVSSWVSYVRRKPPLNQRTSQVAQAAALAAHLSMPLAPQLPKIPSVTTKPKTLANLALVETSTTSSCPHPKLLPP